MKLKRNNNGFALFETLVVVGVITIVGLVAWNFLIHHPTTQVDTESHYFLSGVVSVSFKDGVTSSQAADLINSFGLDSTSDQKLLSKNYFSPVVQEQVSPQNSDTLLDMVNKLKQSPSVSSITSNPENLRSYIPQGGALLTISFNDDVTEAEITRILHEAGITDNKPYVTGNDRSFRVEVPNGQESTYIKKFKQSSIVETATRAINVPLQ
jgi:hypothetical protein